MKADWSVKYKNKRQHGTSVVYYCKNHGQLCNAKAKLVYPETNVSVNYYENDDFEHTATRKCGLSNDVKKAVIGMMADGTQRPKQILKCLEDRGFTVPPKHQIVGFLQRTRKAEGQTIISMGELDHWCSMNHQVPALDDDLFVVAYETHVDENEPDESYFHVLVSTKRLLSFLAMTDAIHTDATYKLNHEGFPVLVFGVSHASRHFHPLAICLSKKNKQKILRSFFKL